MRPTKCYKCHASFPVIPPNFTGPSGYGVVQQKNRRRYVCYDCCSKTDMAYMRKHGKNTLYFSYSSPCNNPQFTHSGTNMTASDYLVSNWPGGINIRPTRVRRGKHNIARERWDVWFTFEGTEWHGVNIGDNQILRCKRIQRHHA